MSYTKRKVVTGINIYSTLAEEGKSTLDEHCGVYWNKSYRAANGYYRQPSCVPARRPFPGLEGCFLAEIRKEAEFFFIKPYIYQFGLNLMRRILLWRTL